MKNSDGQCIQKLKEGEITCETYLDFADDLRNDEECCLLDQMNVSKVDLDVVELQPITLAPPSICQAKSPDTGTRETKDTGIRVFDTDTVIAGITTRYIYIFILNIIYIKIIDI